MIAFSIFSPPPFHCKYRNAHTFFPERYTGKESKRISIVSFFPGNWWLAALSARSHSIFIACISLMFSLYRLRPHKYYVCFYCCISHFSGICCFIFTVFRSIFFSACYQLNSFMSVIVCSYFYFKLLSRSKFSSIKSENNNQYYKL